MVLSRAEHRDDVAWAVCGGEVREGRAEDEKERGEEAASGGAGAPASGHGGRAAVAGVGSGGGAVETGTHEWRWVGFGASDLARLVGLCLTNRAWPSHFGPSKFQPNL